MRIDMSEQGLTSPPYPGVLTTSDRLYCQLGELGHWVIHEQDVLRPLIPERFAEKLTHPDNMPALTVWNNIGIVDKYTVLMYLRTIRESWDLILREHEDAFDSQLALKKRFSVVTTAHFVLREAFTSPEVRELKQQREVTQAQQEMAALQKALRQIMAPAIHEDAVEEQADENDDWFDETGETDEN
jgi:hypothetical protein